MRTFYDTLIRKHFCAPLPADVCKKLDAWLGSIEEDVLFENEDGFRERIVKQKAIDFAVPGWKKISTAQMHQNMVNNMMAAFRAYGLIDCQ